MKEMTDPKSYTDPRIVTLGTVEELTLTGVNKCGSAADTFTGQTELVGDEYPVPSYCPPPGG